jgi:hypothetical protein
LNRSLQLKLTSIRLGNESVLNKYHHNMNPLNKYLLPFIAIIILVGCELNEAEENLKQGDHSFYITGIKESITYEFTSGNGRAVQSDEVKNLTVYIMDSEGNIVYETRYYNNNYDGAGGIPDSIFIPALGAGTYKILALTADYYPYYDYYYQEGDTMSIFDDMVIPTGITSEGPIFVGFEQIALTDATSAVELDMKNISAKISFQLTNSQIAENSAISLEMMTVDAMDYAIIDEEMVPSVSENNYLYNYIDAWNPVRSMYVLPQTINDMTVQFYDYYSGSNWNSSIIFEEQIPLTAGDAITFNLDLEAMLEGSGSGSFNYEDIEWNDLGEVTVP